MSDKPQYEISQWLQILKEPWKKEAIKLWRNRTNHDYLYFHARGLRKVSTLAEAIWDAFPWPMKNDVWEQIHSDYPDVKDFVQKKYHHLLN